MEYNSKRVLNWNKACRGWDNPHPAGWLQMVMYMNTQYSFDNILLENKCSHLLV